MTSGPRLTRRAAHAAVALAVVLGGLAIAGPAHATADFALERLAGNDRVHTAAKVATSTFDSATEALIARADDFPDALAGNHLAGAADAPILLSYGSDVPALTMAALDELGVTDVTLLGGTAALGAAVETELTEAGYTVDRQAGDDRYDTAATIARTQDASTIGETDDGRTALLATGEGFADALAGGPLSYASSLPLLLTPRAGLGDDAASALDALGIEHVLILGGTAAVAPGVEAELADMDITSQRLAGPDRYSSAVEIAEYATANLGFTDANVNIATGAAFPDALTGGPHAGEEAAPILLANTGATTEACERLNVTADSVASGHVFGGTSAVSDQAVDDLETCGGAEHPSSNQDFTATTGRGHLTLPPGSTRSFAFEGIDVAEVEIALAACDNVTVTEGVVTFDRTAGAADLGEVEATIASVDGVPTLPPAQQVTAASGDGTVAFEVRGASGVEECIVALVFADADGDGVLGVDTTGAPTEDFGISGTTTFASVSPATGPSLTEASQTTAGDLDTFTFRFSEVVRVADVTGFGVFSDPLCAIAAVTAGETVASGDGTAVVVVDMADPAGEAGGEVYLQVAEGAVVDGSAERNAESGCVAVTLA